SIFLGIVLTGTPQNQRQIEKRYGKSLTHTTDTIRKHTMMHPTTRKWLYGVATAITLLMGAYGLLDEQLIAAWNMVAAAIFGVATINTNTNTTDGMPRHAKETQS